MPRTQIQPLPNGTLETLTTAPQATMPLVAPLAGVAVTVVAHGTQNALTVYADETTSNVLTQPLTTNQDGGVPGYLDVATLQAQGADLQVALSGGTEVLEVVAPGVYGIPGPAGPAGPTGPVGPAGPTPTLSSPGGTIAIGGTSAAPTLDVAANKFDAYGAAATEQTRAQNAEALLIPLSQRAAANGVATLDGTGNVPANQLANVPSAPLNGLNVLASPYSAKGDGKIVTDAAITSGQLTLSSTQANFTAADVGKAVCVPGAGANGVALTTTISSVAAGVATLAIAAGTTVSAATAVYGTDDTVAIQSAVTAAESVYAATGFTQQVILPAGRLFMYGSLNVSSGVVIWAYGAVSHVHYPALANHGWLFAAASISNFEIHGGMWVGSGKEGTGGTNQFLYQNGSGTGITDAVFRDMIITGWGFTSLFPRNATRVKILENTIIAGGLNNAGFQNEISIDLDGGAPAGGQIIVNGNFIHNAVADAICILSGSNTVGGPFYVECAHNIITADPPTIDAGCGFTNASKTVTDTNASAANIGKYVTATISGVAKGTYITGCTPGVSYTLSANFTGTTGSGSLNVGVYKNSITLELDSTSAVNVSDVMFVNNNVTCYERAGISMAGTGGAGKNIVRGAIRGNMVYNGQVGANGAYSGANNPQGICIGLSGGNEFHDIAVQDNYCTVASPVPPILVQTAATLVNNGRMRGNKFTTGPAQGVATLGAGGNFQTWVSGSGQVVSTTPGTLLLTGIPTGFPTSGSNLTVAGVTGAVSWTSISGNALQGVTIASGSYTATNNGSVTAPFTNAAGTYTVYTSEIQTGDVVRVSRLDPNASTALGELAVPASGIVAGVSFTVKSLQPATPGSVQTGDASGFSWDIIH